MVDHSPQLTNSLRLALEMAQEMVDSFRTSEPWSLELQAQAWRDIVRELIWAGFTAEQFQIAHMVWGEERRIQQQAAAESAARTRRRIGVHSPHEED